MREDREGHKPHCSHKAQKNPRAHLTETDSRGLRYQQRNYGSVVALKEILEPVVDKTSKNVRYCHEYQI